MKLADCVILVSVFLSGCTSTLSAPKRQSLPPPAWMMQTPPNLLIPLSEIIGYSENELRSQNRSF
ncbi:Rz1 family lipoprotein [Proteus sp. G2669]|uniref:Rz1 family lipoprotein n=1 Tax=Proteus TaxID=583 RepID=UPI003267FB12